MSDIDGFIPGFVYDPVRIQEVKAERVARGDLIMASQQAISIQGSFQRLKAAGVTRWSLRDWEIPLLGKHRRPFFQKRGSCIARGVRNAGQASLDVAIAKHAAFLSPAEVAFAPIYTLARHEYGKDRCGYGDGAILSCAASAVHEAGLSTSQLFQGMSEDAQELQAVKYGAPGVGTPAAWIAACKTHTAATYEPDTLELALDCLSSDIALAYACGYVTGNQPDKNGLYRLGSQGGHCRAFTGWVIGPDGRVQLESTESWSAYPAASPNQQYTTCAVEQIPCCKFQTADSQIILAPGDCIVDAAQFWSAIQNGGECWAVAAPQFVPGSMVDISAAPVVA